MEINAYDIPGFVVAFDMFFRTALFDTVKEIPGQTPDFYATSCSTSAIATKPLFAILAAAGILFTKDEKTYQISESCLELDERLPKGLIGDIDYWKEMMDFVKNGFMPRLQDEDNQAQIYAEKVFTVQKLYKPMADELASLFYGQPRSILDIGAGSAVWSLAMRCDVLALLDQAPVIDALRKYISEHYYDLEHEKLRALFFIVDDYRTIEFKKPLYDRIVIANVLHLESDPSEMIKRWVKGLNDGGNIVVIDSFGPNKLSRKLYDMHLAMRSVFGKNHDANTICKWFEDAGFVLDKTISFSYRHPQSLAAMLFSKREKK